MELVERHLRDLQGRATGLTWVGYFWAFELAWQRGLYRTM